jgi:hypothetical protein
VPDSPVGGPLRAPIEFGTLELPIRRSTERMRYWAFVEKPNRRHSPRFAVPYTPLFGSLRDRRERLAPLS